MRLVKRDLLLLPTVGVLLTVAVSALDADEPVVAGRWDFGPEEATVLTPHGGVQRDQAGPRPPEFPDFAENNTAVRLDGKGAYLSIPDPGPDSPFDFTNGDAITLEAWIKLEGIRDGQPMYVIGKGRTNSPRFPRDNQNWALRVVGDGGLARLGFLFASQPTQDGSHWHRWTSQAGFEAATGWHHIAVAYRFGEPESIRGWIDGRPTDGTWDMGGATTKPPVADDDEIWIGSSMGGSPGNSFNGWLDAVAVHRAWLDDKVMAGRFRRVGGPRVVAPQPEVMPELPEVPQGRVLVTFSEGLPTHERWLNEGEAWPEETARWIGDAFLLPRIPLRYDDWGIRESWRAPLLVRMAADVEIPPGTHQFLVRARGLSRLWIDGQLVARTEAVTKRPPDGEEPITPVAEPPLPGLRPHGYRQQEGFGEAVITPASEGSPRQSRVMLELVVGGKNLRTETGEVCVSRLTADGESYIVLSPVPNEELPLTDAAIEPALERIESSLATYDDRRRRAAAASQDPFWARRHAMAREWAEQNPVPGSSSPAAATGGQSHPVDAFIEEKIERLLLAASRTDSAEAAHFHESVLPILRENCFRCHGEKDNGGLKLDSRDAARKGGDSEIPAIVPGDPAASELLVRVGSDDEFSKMPPTGDGLTPQQIETLTQWVRSGASWPSPPLSEREAAFAPVIDDEAFLRRIFLDTVGVPPTADEVRHFLADSAPDQREQLIGRLLQDERFADHWMSFWLDLLAENPTLINASLNSTGPFRWFLYDALRDDKPLDRMVTELLLMRGAPHEGGSAGFGIAAENDAPFAEKGHIVASGFLGIELQCARCHDSPYHTTTQQDLFSLAAMFQRKETTVPATSRVPAAFFEKKARDSLIRVTLRTDQPVRPEWPFADVTGVEDGPEIDPLMRQPNDSRERLAALVTAPRNRRFAKVMVNRVWKQLIGAGIVEPVHDWEGRAPSHPELLDWLAQELITHDYDLKHVIRLIVTSRTYQREASEENLSASPEMRLFNAPERRRLTAEQVVDSLYAATGTVMDVEELTFVHDGRRPMSSRLTLGRPRRAWMFATLNNERDRPSLALPRARIVADVLEAFGWTGSRQKPITQRETDPNVLQPGILANGTLTMTLTRASAGSELAQLAVDADSPAGLAETLFLRVLGRSPKPEERVAFTRALAEDFETRLLSADAVERPPEPSPLPLVTWFNHLRPEANEIQQEIEHRVRQGPQPDPRLDPQWRTAYEDVVWSLINHREFVWMP
jgi:mono/diheme cytochrome c family protein